MSFNKLISGRWLLAFLLLSAAMIFPVYAETIPATPVGSQLPERDFTTYGYPDVEPWVLILAADPDAACRSDVMATYGTAYTGVSMRAIIPPRTVVCQILYYYGYPTTDTLSFKHYWKCLDGTGLQDVDVPLATCTTYACPAGQNWVLNGNQCTRTNNKDPGNSCNDEGNPINSGTGNKYQDELDYAVVGSFPIRFGHVYNSQSLSATGFSSRGWRNSLNRSIAVLNGVLLNRTQGV